MKIAINCYTFFLLAVTIPAVSQQFGFALEQINGGAIVAEGLSGKGVKVGIIDGGFLNLDKRSTLSHLIENNLIKGYKDYLFPDAIPFTGSAAMDDGHGTDVLELIAGKNESKNLYFGLATQASFYLARTDHGGFERRKEEEYAIEALEWMASQGVRIINISLGYNTGFNDPKQNYRHDQIDGKSTILTEAVDRIAKEHNVLIVVAAGNDGNKKWEIVASPADASEALTVGATKYKTWDNMRYSSKGPEWLDYLKPEVSCYASSGTSFSAPIITGLAACLLEYDSTLSYRQLKSIIVQSSHQHLAPTNLTGYGVPDSEKALHLIDGDTIPHEIASIRTKKKSIILEVGEVIPYVPVYHLGDKWQVLSKVLARPKNEKVRVTKNPASNQSIVLINNKPIKIYWSK